MTLLILYSMDGCPHCENAKQLLHKEIKEGMVKVEPAQNAPQGVAGYPHFINAKNPEKQHTGYPGTVKTLLDKLEINIEGFKLTEDTKKDMMKFLGILLGIAIAVGVVLFFLHRGGKSKQRESVTSKENAAAFSYKYLNNLH